MQMSQKRSYARWQRKRLITQRKLTSCQRSSALPSQLCAWCKGWSWWRQKGIRARWSPWCMCRWGVNKSRSESCLSCLNFVGETFNKVLVDDAIGGGKECEDMRDKVAFVVVELVCPVVHILRKVHFLGCPEGCLGLLVHLPDLWHASVMSVV